MIRRGSGAPLQIQGGCASSRLDHGLKVQLFQKRRKVSYLDTYASKSHIFDGKSNGTAWRSLWDRSQAQQISKNIQNLIFFAVFWLSFSEDDATKMRQADFEDSTTASSEPDVDLADVAPITAPRPVLGLKCQRNTFSYIFS